MYINGEWREAAGGKRFESVNPATGEEIWRFDGYARVDEEQRLPGACRGVSYWQAPEPQADAACQRRIFKGDMLGRVWAIDADSGEACEDFGSLAGHPGYVDTAKDFDNRGLS